MNRSYWPDMEATGQLLTQLCEALADEFQVEVIAGQPNSVSADTPADWKQRTVHNGVRIHRLRHLRLPKRNLLLRMVNYLSFQWSVRRMLKRIGRPDVLVFETDPFTLAKEAGRLMNRQPIRVVGYLQDIHPDVGVALGKVQESSFIRTLRRELFDVYH
ncbi:MAG: glycosyltransferase, partial [Planctomyces sp.]